MATRKEWNDDDVRGEIREAVRIVSEQREKAEYRRLHGLFGGQSDDGPDDGKPKPPPDKGEPDPPKSSKRSLYWGDDT